VNGFQYENNVLQFFPHAVGYVKRNTNNTYLYVYQYKDHLGNIRLSYADVNGNGTIQPASEILEENNYYPFGLKHKGYNEVVNSNRSEAAEKYKFQEQERNEELGLDWDSFKWRNYDYAIGRFMNIDPLTEKYNYWTPYAFSGNRLIDARELEGLEPMSIHKHTRNLVIAVQGNPNGDTNPKYGATQVQNAVKNNKNLGIDKDGLGKIMNFDKFKGTQVGVYASSQSENTKKDIAKSIRDFKNINEHGNVILIGHSLGADNLVEMVNENKDLKVNLLITIDILDEWDDDNIPPNVKTAHNFYNANAGLLTLGGEDIEAENPNVTTVTNTGLNTNHTDIDNDFIDVYMDIIERNIY